jgi:hypothetical protein
MELVKIKLHRCLVSNPIGLVATLTAAGEIEKRETAMPLPLDIRIVGRFFFSVRGGIRRH